MSENKHKKPPEILLGGLLYAVPSSFLQFMALSHFLLSLVFLPHTFQLRTATKNIIQPLSVPLKAKHL